MFIVIMDNKRRFFKLIENYINDFRGDAVQEFYGKNTRIKLHTFNTGVKDNSIMLEAVVILGDVITEDTTNDALAHILIQDAVIYFFPELKIKTYVRFDA
jgi:hypothetical protein